MKIKKMIASGAVVAAAAGGGGFAAATALTAAPAVVAARPAHIFEGSYTSPSYLYRGVVHAHLVYLYRG